MSEAETEGGGFLSDQQVSDIAEDLHASRVQKHALSEAMEAMEGAKEAIDMTSFLRLMGVVAKQGKLNL